MKAWKIELLDTKTEKVYSGYQVYAENMANARLLAHALPEVAEDKDMKFMVYSVEDPETREKKVFYTQMSTAETTFTILG